MQSDSIRAKLFTDAELKYLHNIKHCGMRILDIQNLLLSPNNFYISINDLNLENNKIETIIIIMMMMIMMMMMMMMMITIIMRSLY